LKSNEYWSIVVAEKTAEEIMQVLLGWSLSLNLPLHELCFLTDRGGEFEDISPYVKSHVKTAAYSPQSNGSVERIHKELGAMCRLYETTPDVIADLWRKRNFVGNIKCLPEEGSLILKYVQKKGSKVDDTWVGPYIVLKKIGSKMVEAMNLNTERKGVIHLNDLKEYFRPSTSNWKLNQKYKEIYFDRLDIDGNDYVKGDMNVNWKNLSIFVDIDESSDLEEIILKAIKDLPKKIVFVIPEFKERVFWEFFKCFDCENEFVKMNKDSDLFLNEGESVGFRMWNSYIGVLNGKQILAFAKNNEDLVKELRKGSESGEVLKCEGFQEEDLED
jgi:hypothetical protein